MAATATTIRYSPLTGRRFRPGVARVQRGGVRPQAIYRLPLTMSERREMEENKAELVPIGIGPRRPRTLAECPPDVEPCPFVGCRYHLAIDLQPHTGQTPVVRAMFPDKELAEMRETCSMRVARRAEARRETLSDEAVGALMNLTAEAVRLETRRALRKVRAALEGP